MWLYRVMSKSRDGSGMFYDATASLDDATRVAQVIQRRERAHDVTIEAENWPGLNWWKYQWHRIMGTHEGFGVNFKRRHSLEIENIKVVWPRAKV